MRDRCAECDAIQPRGEFRTPAVSGQMLLGMDAGAIGRVEEYRRRRIEATERAVVAHVGPQPPGPGLDLGQHRHRGVVAMDALGLRTRAP